MKIEPAQKQTPKYPAIVKAAAVVATAAALTACQQQQPQQGSAGAPLPLQPLGGVM
jgi:hypothetical protein